MHIDVTVWVLASISLACEQQNYNDYADDDDVHIPPDDGGPKEACHNADTMWDDGTCESQSCAGYLCNREDDHFKEWVLACCKMEAILLFHSPFLSILRQPACYNYKSKIKFMEWFLACWWLTRFLGSRRWPCCNTTCGRSSCTLRKKVPGHRKCQKNQKST